ncbi:MAG TPA: fatty acid--CoA ligase family protein [Actinocatenispora sp.]
MTWTTAAGIVLRDLVPAADRRRWVAAGYCPGRDLFTLYAAHERADPHRPAVVTAAGALDRAALGRRARRLTGALAAAGHGAHDIVAVRVPNGVDAVVAELAVAALGAVALPVPSGRGHRDTASLLARSRAAALVTTDADAVRGLDLPYLRTVLAPDADGPAYAEAVASEAPARILVSSGSEDEPKMVAYSHDAMAGGRGNYAAALYAGTDPVRALLLVPLSSSYGSIGLVTLVARGGTLVLLDRFDPAAALAAVTRHRPTHLLGVPTMLRRMADLPPSADEDLSSLRTVVSSAAMLVPATDAACRARFGCPVVNVYGSSDGVNCHTARGGAGVGRPDPAVAEIRLGADDEIQCRGPMTPLCYVGAPELDARYRLPGGWVRTGDRGRVDPDGSLHVVERIRQVVIRGGYTISPAEVELLLGAHPAVADVACVPVPDADLGERLCACVVPRPGAAPPELAELTGFLAEVRGLEPRKLPEHLVVLDALPLGPTGKVCRRTLAGLAADRTAG